MHIDQNLQAADLAPALERFFALAAPKLRNLQKSWDATQGTPVFTVEGRYTTRGWTEWTQGFMYGCQLLQFDATGEEAFLHMARENTRRYMAPHVSHTGVHDHGFNNVSTYGNLRRLALEGRTGETPDAIAFYELALQVSGAVQAARWSKTHDGTGFIHSFNGPHSLFSDTIRSCRALVVADRLGHKLMGENDEAISLEKRAIEHIENTLRYNVYYGRGRDTYDVPGRVVHESIFNMNDGRYRCPSTQQGYSPFSTWTRGLAWVMLGCAEHLEYFRDRGGAEGGFIGRMREAAAATADFYISNTTADGIPFWDAGAPGLVHLPAYRDEPAQPDNPHEPLDSSAAAITAQGLLRLGKYLGNSSGKAYWQAGLTVARTLLGAPFLSEDPAHQGLLLHSIYHRPNGWDHTPKGAKVPHGESSMWGDYHAMELALYLQRINQGGAYYTFYGP
jgi:hypothetical protein